MICRGLAFSCSIALAVTGTATPAAAADPFGVQEIASLGRTVTAELADVDGDGDTDLLQIVTEGMPPDQVRTVRIYRQDENRRIPASPAVEAVLPASCAAYDVGDVDGVAGVELLLLRPRGIHIFSFVPDESGALVARAREARIPADLTVGIASDERGLDRLRMVTRALGNPARLVAPGLGETFLLGADGSLYARVASGARANFFIEPSMLMLSESDIQLFLDAPRISIGDVDGDGRADVVASQRHQLHVFYQDENGGFPQGASRSIKLGRVAFEDHIRGSGAVRTKAVDIDADGLADLILSESVGGLMDAGFNTFIHFNRGSGWDLEHADYAFEDPKATGADALLDVDGDGRLELVRAGVRLSILELIEIFIQEAIDADLRVFDLERPAAVPETPRRPRARFHVKFEIPLDFETSRSAGFIPTLQHDFNGDGFLDYISSSDGTRLEVFVGNPDTGYPGRSARQEISTEGQIHPGDVNADGLTDLVLFNSRRDNQPLRILTNTGVLPGTVRQVELRAQPGG